MSHIERMIEALGKIPHPEEEISCSPDMMMRVRQLSSRSCGIEPKYQLYYKRRVMKPKCDNCEDTGRVDGEICLMCDARMKKSVCCTCGYSWKTGTDGMHSCSQRLKEEVMIHKDDMSRIKEMCRDAMIGDTTMKSCILDIYHIAMDKAHGHHVGDRDD